MLMVSFYILWKYQKTTGYSQGVQIETSGAKWVNLKFFSYFEQFIFLTRKGTWLLKSCNIKLRCWYQSGPEINAGYQTMFDVKTTLSSCIWQSWPLCCPSLFCWKKKILFLFLKECFFWKITIFRFNDMMQCVNYSMFCKNNSGHDISD